MTRTIVRARSSSSHAGERVTIRRSRLASGDADALRSGQAPAFDQRARRGPARCWLAWRAFTSAMTRPMSFIDEAPSSAMIACDRGAGFFLAHLLRAGSARSPRSRPLRRRPAPRGCPCGRASTDSRRCLIIFCSTSVTSSIVVGGRGAGAQLDVAVLDRRLDQADRRGRRPCRRPSSRATSAALMSSRIIARPVSFTGKRQP